MNDLQRKTLVLDGTRVSYLEKEAPEPSVLLLHGFASGSYIWKDFSKRISGSRILIPDLPGHGFSELSNQDPTLDSLVNWVEKFRLAAGMNRFVGVGHSMGAAILAAYSTAHRGQLSGMVLESPPDDRSRIPFFWKVIATPVLGDFLMNFFPPTKGILRKRLRRGVHDPSLFTEEMIEEAWNSFNKGRLKKWIPRALRVAPLPVEWEKVPHTCRFVYGLQDGLVKPAFVERLRKALPSCEFYPFENCKHVPHLEYPDRLLRSLGNRAGARV